jgi:Cu/Ag efflux pump CusA
MFLSDMGSEIQKPWAIMLVGGIIVCPAPAFTVLPQFYRGLDNKTEN